MSHDWFEYEYLFRPQITGRYWQANVTVWRCADDHSSGSLLREPEHPLAVEAANETRGS